MIRPTDYFMRSYGRLFLFFIIWLAAISCFNSDQSSTSTTARNANGNGNYKDARDVALLMELKAAAGIYQSQTVEHGSVRSTTSGIAAAAIKHTVIITISNLGYLPMLRNFECFIDRLKLKALVFSLDDVTHRYIVQRHKTDKKHKKSSSFAKNNNDNNKAAALYSHRWYSHDPLKYGKDSSAAAFRSARFHNISCSKFAVVYSVLSKGFDVFYVDVDVALIRDPFPLLMKFVFPLSSYSSSSSSSPSSITPDEKYSKILHPATASAIKTAVPASGASTLAPSSDNSIDFIHSINALCPKSRSWTFDSEEEGNTGLFYVRSNARTKALFRISSNLSHHYSNLDDQSIFWQTIRYCRHASEQVGPNIQRHISASNRLSQNLACKYLQFDVRGECSTTESIPISTSTTPNPNLNRKDAVSICNLDGCQFSSGALRLGEGTAYKWLQKALKSPNPNFRPISSSPIDNNHTTNANTALDIDYKLYSLHANYLMGLDTKIDALRKYGYWLISSDASAIKDHLCNPFNPTI